MKKLFALILALCLILSLAACTSKENRPADPTDTQAPKTEAPTAAPTTAAPTTAAPTAEALDAAAIAAQVNEAMSALESARAHILVDFSIAVRAQGMDMNLSMGGDIDSEFTQNPRAEHTKGTMTAMGQQFDMETYRFFEGDKKVEYEWDDELEVFLRSEEPIDAETDSDSMIDEMKLDEGKWTAEDNGDVYVLTGEISGDAFSSIPMDGMDVLDADGQTTATVPAVLTVDKQTMYLRSLSMEMDMSEYAGTAFSGMSEDAEASGTMKIEMTLSDYNQIAPIQPPAFYEDAPSGDDPIYVDPDQTGFSYVGEIEGPVYTLEDLGVRLTLPDGWFFYDEDALDQVNSNVLPMFGSDFAEAMQAGGTVVDVYMSSLDETRTANMTLQAYQTALDAYSDAMIFQLLEETVKAQFAAAGAELETYEVVTVRVDGADRDAVHMVLNMNGQHINEYQIWYRQSGASYYGVFTVADTTGADPVEVFAAVG